MSRNTHTRRTLALLRVADREGIEGAAERVRELEATLENTDGQSEPKVGAGAGVDIQ